MASIGKELAAGVVSSLIGAFLWTWIEPVAPAPHKTGVLPATEARPARVKSSFASSSPPPRGEVPKIKHPGDRAEFFKMSDLIDIPRPFLTAPIYIVVALLAFAVFNIEFLPHYPRFVRWPGRILSIPASMMCRVAGVFFVPLIALFGGLLWVAMLVRDGVEKIKRRRSVPTRLLNQHS
jgi:hypothetical protein